MDRYKKFLEEKMFSPQDLLATHPHFQKLITAIEASLIFKELSQFSPQLVGTQPLFIDTDKSDIDILCCCENFDDFKKMFTALHPSVLWTTGASRNEYYVLARLECAGYSFEIFCQNLPPQQQAAYQHMMVEGRLLYLGGEKIRQKICSLKTTGIKTEPAFAIAFDIQGDPYEQLLELYKKPLDELRKIFHLA